MNAVILAAGQGSRIKDIKSCKSKCMLPVNGKPLLLSRLEQLTNINNIYIVINYEDKEIENYFENIFTAKEIHYVKQHLENYGIVNAVRKAINDYPELQEDDILLTLGDEYYSEFNTDVLCEAFSKNPHDLLLMAVPTDNEDDIRKNYTIKINDSYEVDEAIEKPTSVFNNLIGTGTVIFPKGYFSLFYSSDFFTTNNKREITDYFNFASMIGIKVRTFINNINYCNVNTKEELYKLNQNSSEYSINTDIITLFSKVIEVNHDKTAIICGNNSITYGELDKLSDKVSNSLRDLGIAQGNCIALLFDRSIEYIIVFLAILKNNCYYLPIDKDLPVNRINYMLTKSNSILLVKDSSISIDGLIDIPTKIYEDLRNMKSSPSCSADAPTHISENKEAYVMFTSGSTGMPKGVVIRHQEVINFTYAMKEIFDADFKKTLVIGMLASFSFDLSVQAIFPALLLGHKLHIFPSIAKTNPDLLLKHLNQVDVCDCTPHILDLLTTYLEKNPKEYLHEIHMFSAGDRLKKSTSNKFFRYCPNSILFNCYGPTECTVETLFFRMNKEIESKYSDIPLGKPIPNTRIYILDDNGKIILPGNIGEIFISGSGVGQGYINDNEITKNVFVSDLLNNSKTMYKTGDYGYLGSDGNIYFIGRKDFQIKHKGYRIETAEIEKTIENIDNIEHCRVLLRTCANQKKLIAYFTYCNKVPSVDTILEKLTNNLPQYMIPQMFIPVNDFKMNNNGKLDTSVLLDIPLSAALKSSCDDELDTQDIVVCKIKEAAEAVLEYPITNDLSLLALGFDSLMFFMFMFQIEEIFDISLNVETLNTNIRISDIAKIIKDRAASKSNDLEGDFTEKRLARSFYALPTQKYLIDLEDIAASNDLPAVNLMAYVVPTVENLDYHLLNHAYQIVQKNNDAFSIKFHKTGNKVRVTGISGVIDNIANFEDQKATEMLYYGKSMSNISKDILDKVITKFNDLSYKSESLVRLHLYTSDNHNVLVLAVNHSVFDYLSLMCFLKSLELTYKALLDSKQNAYSLKNKKTSFYTYIKQNQINNREISDDFRRDLHYVIAKQIPVPSLWNQIGKINYDHRHNLNMSNYTYSFVNDIYEYNCILSEAISKKADEYVNDNGIDKFSFLFSSFISLFSNIKNSIFPVLLFDSGRANVHPASTIGYFSYLRLHIIDTGEITEDFVNLIHKTSYKLKQESIYSHNLLNFSYDEDISKVLQNSIIFDYQKLYNSSKSDSQLWSHAYPIDVPNLSNPLSFRIYDYKSHMEISVLFHRDTICEEDVKNSIETYINFIDKI